MALAAATVWEVRNAGSDTLCSGGYVTGSAGTDYSQQDAAQYTGTNLVIDGALNTKVTSATHNFVTADVGNLIQVTAGTNFTVGFYQIASVAANAATLDRAVGTVGSTGGTFAVGGALTTPAKALAAAVGSNLIYIKSGTYGFAANPTMGPGAVFPGPGTEPTRLYGYGTTRGDNPTGGTRPTIVASASCTIMLPIATTGWWVQGLVLDCANVANTGIDLVSGSADSYSGVSNVWVKTYKQNGILGTGNTFIRRCEVSAGVTGATAGINGGQIIIENYVHDNVSVGILLIAGKQSLATLNVVANNSGASSDGIQYGYGNSVIGNTVYQSGRDGIRNSNPFLYMPLTYNNLLVSNAGYGLNFTSAVSAAPHFDGNAFYGNVSGLRNNIGSGTLDITLSAAPFTNPGAGDYSLNTTAGGGAAARAHGTPGVFPGATTTDYSDVGAAQHTDPAGVGGSGPNIIVSSGASSRGASW